MPKETKEAWGKAPFSAFWRFHLPAKNFLPVIGGSCAAQSGRAAAGLPFLSRTRWASCPAHLQALSRPVHGLAQAVCGRALAPGPLFFHYAAMRLTFHGSVLILGGSSELGRALALALRAEGAQVCCVCRDDAGCARCAQDGLPALVLGDPETLPARCEALLGRPVVFESASRYCNTPNRGPVHCPSGSRRTAYGQQCKNHRAKKHQNSRRLYRCAVDRG